jgi:DNA polymerase III epsilon subunit-like protein
MHHIVVGDFEATNSVIHTIALRAISLGKGRVRAGVKTRSGNYAAKPVHVCTTNESVVIKITNAGPGKGKTFEKHGTDVNTCIETDFSMLFMSFPEAVTFMIDFIDDHGGVFATHNLHGDLEFLKCSQEHFGGKRVVKQCIDTCPKTGLYDKRWECFTLLCTWSLLCVRCPKFMKAYQASKPGTTSSGKYVSTELQSFSRFTKGDPGYIQTHTAAQDVIDLCEVLKMVYTYDGDKMFGGGHDCVNWNIFDTLPKVETPKPVASDNRPSESQLNYFNRLYQEKTIPAHLEAEMKTKTFDRKTISHYIDILLNLK